jgi:hypothetical protein
MRWMKGAEIDNLGLGTRSRGLTRVAAKRLAVVKARETVLRESIGSTAASRDVRVRC